jgi:hypothetical protein
MKATILLVDDLGNQYRGVAELSPSGDAHHVSKQATVTLAVTAADLDFSLPVRAFLKKYAASSSSGAARFTILLARLTRGSGDVEIAHSDLETEWSKATAHLGSFNRAHPTRAKDRAWVDSTKHGSFRLGPHWREAFRHG